MTLGADEFLNVYDQIEGVILEDLAVDVIPQETIQWIKNLMSSTVPKGKYFRSKIVVDTFSILRGRDLTPEEFKEAYTVGWAIEFVSHSRNSSRSPSGILFISQFTPLSPLDSHTLPNHSCIHLLFLSLLFAVSS